MDDSSPQKPATPSTPVPAMPSSRSATLPSPSTSSRFPTMPLAPTAGVAVVGLVLISILGAILHNSAFDLSVTQSFNSTLTGTARTIVDGIYTSLRGKYIPFIVAGATFLVMFLTRSLFRPLTAAATIWVSWNSVLIPKALVARDRPEWDLLSFPPNVHPSDLSFPSGHTTFVTVTVLTVFILIYRGLDPNRARSSVGTAGLIITAVIGLACVAIIVTTILTRGVHFPTDALGGVIWSATFTPFVWAIWERVAAWLNALISARVAEK